MGKGVSILVKGLANLGDGLAGLVGGTIHAVGSTARGVGSGVANLFQGAESGLEETGEGIGYAAHGAGYAAKGTGRLTRYLGRTIAESRGGYVNIPNDEFQRLLRLEPDKQREILMDYSILRGDNVRISKSRLSKAIDEINPSKKQSPVLKAAYQSTAAIFLILLISMFIPPSILGNVIGSQSKTLSNFRLPLLLLFLFILGFMKILLFQRRRL